MKIANKPRSVVATKRGCVLSRMVRPPTYPAKCNQKTPRKNGRNESKISMKKYHHKPILGVRSGTRSWKPYVAGMKSHEPVMMYERASRIRMVEKKMVTDFKP